MSDDINVQNTSSASEVRSGGQQGGLDGADRGAIQNAMNNVGSTDTNREAAGVGGTGQAQDGFEKAGISIERQGPGPALNDNISPEAREANKDQFVADQRSAVGRVITPGGEAAGREITPGDVSEGRAAKADGVDI